MVMPTICSVSLYPNYFSLLLLFSRLQIIISLPVNIVLVFF